MKYSISSVRFASSGKFASLSVRKSEDLLSVGLRPGWLFVGGFI